MRGQSSLIRVAYQDLWRYQLPWCGQSAPPAARMGCKPNRIRLALSRQL